MKKLQKNLLTILAIAMVQFCNPTSESAYVPVIDTGGSPGTGGSGSTVAQGDCTNPQAAAAIPTVAYTTPLTTSFGGTTVQNLEMGAINTGSSTTSDFRFFAPTAVAIELLKYTNASDAIDAPALVTAMTKDTQSGVWYANSAPLGKGSYYRYRINCMVPYVGASAMKDYQRYIPDPYSRAMAGSNGHSIVMAKNEPFAWSDSGNATWFGPTSAKRPNTKDYIVYEMHIGDFTSSVSCSTAAGSCASSPSTPGLSIAKLSSANNRGKYNGVKDMIPYLNNLGVNAVELMPVHEFSNDNKTNPEGYSWGYLPVSFFAPESSYATSSTDGSAVFQLKDLINTMHANGIAVILDVVLTHVSNEFNYLYWADPSSRYYFRLSGNAWSNLGTGNWIDDNKTTKPFAYKMVMDNVNYWLKEFHVDGFRYDLVVGTLEATLKDMQNLLCSPTAGNCAAGITDNLGNTIKRPNFMTGENWLGSTRHAFMVQSNLSNASTPYITFNTKQEADYPGFSQWNDYFRESVKGLISGDTLTQTTNRAKTAIYFSSGRDDGITVAKSNHPVDTLNYIESHDEATIASAVLGNEFKASAGLFVLLTSHGIPMMQQGQEFMRSKAIQDQSQGGNEIDWQLMQQNKAFYSVASYLVKLRKACGGLRLGKDPATDGINATYSAFDAGTANQTYSFFTKDTGNVCTGTGIAAIDGKSEFRIFINMTNQTKTYTVETLGAKWCALAQVNDTDGNISTAPATYYLNKPPPNSGVTDTSTWGATTTTWNLSPYSFTILTKVTTNCTSG